MDTTQANHPAGDGHASDVLARMGEFVDPATPWHRGLWLASSVLSLRELGEHAEQLHADAISPQQVKDSAAAAREALRLDAGIDANIRSTLDRILSTPMDLAGGARRNELSHLAQRADQSYLHLWESELAKPVTSRPRPERVARHLSAHLLDAGVSPERIDRLLREATGEAEPLTALCAAAADLLVSSPTRHTVVVPLTDLPQLFRQLDTGKSRQVAVLLTADALRNASHRQWSPDFRGGLAFDVQQRDPWAAVANAGELLTRLQARLSVSKQPVTLNLPALVTVVGYQELFPLRQGQKAVRVPALDRSRKTLQVSGYADADALDDALELLAALGTGTPGAALTNGWAAIEGLLAGAGERNKIVAAERLADIVTADWPRSELTWLANARFVAEATDPSLHGVLSDKGKNTVNRKVAALEAALKEGLPIAYDRPRDVAALHRLERLLAQPAATLTQVRNVILTALRRLYVQRNLVMHAGSFRSVARATALRTVPPLAAAGMDRFVHAADLGVHPLMLAARARVELELLPTGGAGRALGQLLD